jgi:Beta protein
METTMALPLQIPLLRPEPLRPLPVDENHYVVAIQNKKGELDALSRASDATWQQMTPLVHLVGPLTKRSTPFLASTVSNWLKRVRDAVGSRPVYLDVLRLDPGFPVVHERNGVIQPVLSEIYAAARRRGVRFVPVAWAAESSNKHLEMVAAAAAEDGHGVALRYRMLQVVLPADTTRRQMLTEHLSRLGVAASSTDLLIDFGYLSQDEEYDPTALAQSIAEVEKVGAWRSVVLLATTMPRMLGCIEEGTVGELPRQEWELWNEVVKSKLPRKPAFGDYAIQHPRPPEGGGPGMRANVRYTARETTLIARGHGPVLQEGVEQYRDLCQQLVARDEYAGRRYSWGDEVIDDCAKGVIPPGSQSLWRGVGTSHHIRLVTEQLRELAEAQ